MAGTEESNGAKITHIKRALTGEILVEDAAHPLVNPHLRQAVEDMAAEAGGVVGGLPLAETPAVPRRRKVVITTERGGVRGRRPV